MKKILLIGALLLGSSAALYAANDGEAVYEAHCKACHMLKPRMDKQKMMQMSQAERMSMKEKMMKMMKAPPMSKVSAKLKHDFGNDKAKIVAFVKDYIVNPSALHADGTQAFRHHASYRQRNESGRYRYRRELAGRELQRKVG